MTAVLWHLELSHYNEKARWALDFKGIPHVRRAPMPGLHRLYALAITRGAQRRFPVLTLNGRTIGDSTAIIAALEHHRPDPPLYPAASDERRRALALEDLFDEELAPAVRLLFWHHTLGDLDLVVDSLLSRASARRRAALRRLAPLIPPLLRRDLGIDADAAVRACELLLASMDRIEREVGASGYLVGDRFSVADLTAAAVFTPVLAPPERPYMPDRVASALAEMREELSTRPGGKWVTEMYARHRGASAEVAA